MAHWPHLPSVSNDAMKAHDFEGEVLHCHKDQMMGNKESGDPKDGVPPISALQPRPPQSVISQLLRK